jgi:hypothetical protein
MHRHQIRTSNVTHAVAQAEPIGSEMLMRRLHAELTVHRRQAHAGEVVVVHEIVVALIVIAIGGFSSMDLRYRLSDDCCLSFMLCNVLQIDGILIDGAVFF